jgi:hypothetical protein
VSEFLPSILPFVVDNADQFQINSDIRGVGAFPHHRTASTDIHGYDKSTAWDIHGYDKSTAWDIHGYDKSTA